MRLQVAVQRHELPQVRLIFNTTSNHGPGKQRLTTVSEFLLAINTVVPLESTDGEWGLEDYVVEVSATADQEQAYECFHFQELNDVFKEDDEVLIRSLSNEELRERRQGGRLQITADGRHLIDGLSWGRRWRGGQGRPEIDIPPRKRRRLMIEPEDTNIELEFPPSRELVRISNEAEDDEDEDEDDEDFDDEAEAESEDGSIGADEVDGKDELQDEGPTTSSSRHIKITEAFMDADIPDQEDTNDDEGEQGAEDDDDIERQLSEGGENLSAEVQGLMDDAPDVTEELHPRRQKRGGLAMLNGPSRKSVSFEGLSSPVKVVQLNGEGALLNGSSEENGVAKDNLPNVQIGAESRAESSSSGSSSDEESDLDSDSDAFSDDDESESSSDESSDSGESTSSSESSLSSVRSTTKAASAKSLKDTKSMDASTSLADVPVAKPESTTTVVSQAPPGFGTVKTKRHNNRKKRKRVLTQLKAEGKLPENSNFEDLEAYFANYMEDVTSGATGKVEENEVEPEPAELAARKEDIFRRLNATTATGVPTDTEIASTATPVPTVRTNQPMADLPVASNTSAVSQVQDNREPGSSEGLQKPRAMASLPTAFVNVDDGKPYRTSKSDVTEEVLTPVAGERSTSKEETERSSSKRARLDLAGSRRMLFNALGVRNPKTQAAEQALREKLSKPARQIKFKERNQEDETTPTALPQDLWKSKLTISAVECGPGGGFVEIPTFPFKHPWQIRKEKEKALSQADLDMLDYDDRVSEEQDTQDVEIAATDEDPSQAMTTSRTLTTGSANDKDDISIPTDFGVLIPLSPAHLVQGTVIAYKELYINARFEPEQSVYRTARITANNSGRLQLKLSARDRRHAEAQYHEDTGERIYGKFDIPTEEDDEPDDGMREMGIEDMIEPKLVSLSQANVAIPESIIEPNPSASQVQDSVKDNITPVADVVADSNASKPEAEGANLSSPRRAQFNGFIKEAGFDSGLDDQLLQPLPKPAALRGGSGVKEQEEQGLEQEPEPEPEQPTIVEEQDNAEDSWKSTAEPVSSPDRAADDPSYMPISSPTSNSIVDSVRYPHLSLLELDIPSVAAESSSHQDAQRLTPIPLPEMEQTTVLHDDSHVHEHGKTPGRQLSVPPAADLDFAVNFSSHPSEVQQPQFPDIRNTQKPQPIQQRPKPSLSPLLQYDGSASPIPSHHSTHSNHSDHSDNASSNNESLDSAGLPSLRFLASSQTQRHDSRSRSKPVSKPAPTIKPEPSRRSPRTKRTTALSTDRSDRSDTETNASSQPRFKPSRSQRPRMSQILDDTIIVDLTQSSPLAPKNIADKTKEQKGVTAASKSGRNGAAGLSGSQQGQAAALRKTFEGLGERSFLKKRKKTSL